MRSSFRDNAFVDPVGVATGAAVGAAARWSIGELVDTSGFPWATLIVNLVGCLAMGVASIRLHRGTASWSFAVTGLLGGFTTASTFGVETRQLLADDRLVAALAYVLASLGGGVAAVGIVRRALTGSSVTG